MKISVMEISCTLNEKINNNGIIENVRKWTWCMFESFIILFL